MNHSFDSPGDFFQIAAVMNDPPLDWAAPDFTVTNWGATVDYVASNPEAKKLLEHPLVYQRSVDGKSAWVAITPFARQGNLSYSPKFGH